MRHSGNGDERPGQACRPGSLPKSDRKGFQRPGRRLFEQTDEAHADARSKMLQREHATVRKADRVVVRARFDTREDDVLPRTNAALGLHMLGNILKRQAGVVLYADRARGVSRRSKSDASAREARRDIALLLARRP